MTAIFSMSHIPVTLTLTPLRIGTIVGSSIRQHMPRAEDSQLVRLKWPNDILLDDKKVSGVLIRIHEGYMLVVS